MLSPPVFDRLCFVRRGSKKAAKSCTAELTGLSFADPGSMLDANILIADDELSARFVNGLLTREGCRVRASSAVPFLAQIVGLVDVFVAVTESVWDDIEGG
jgi:hypothetical protein